MTNKEGFADHYIECVCVYIYKQKTPNIVLEILEIIL